jgi:hypothetical protein
MSKTNFLENELLDHVLRNSAYTPPTTIYVALFTAAPSDAGGGTEVSGGNYARQSAAFDVASGGATQNTSEIAYPVATGNWGTITHFALFDASSGGNMLYHAPLAASKAINTDDQFKFAAGAIDISED